MDFDTIYNSYYETVMRVSFRITGSLVIAEDLCQEAFLKLIEKKIKIDNPESIKFYLIKIVRNLSLNHRYRKKIESRVYEEYSKGSKKSSKEDSLSSIVRKEEISDIQKAILLIPYKYRIPLILREYEELNYRDIGRITKSSESAVKVHIHRGRAILKEKLLEVQIG